MSAIVVSVADCRCSSDPAQSLITYALGSCIAVGIYDPLVKAGGMLHFMLPDSAADRVKAGKNPAMFGDTGIAQLVDRMKRMGGDPRRFKIRIAGGAQMLEREDMFHIGKRNYLAARKSLWKLGLMLEMEAVGGNQSRNLGLDLANGEFWVHTNDRALLSGGALTACAK